MAFRHSRSLSASLVSLGLLAASAARAQQPDSVEAEPPPAVQAEYRDVVGRAISEFDLGHVAEARALFLRAHELWPSARTRRTLGMTAFELRMYPRALSELQAALDDVRRPLPPDQRAQVVGLIEQAKAFVGRYWLQLTPANAELFADGARVAAPETLVIGVGVHQLVARAPGYGELRRELIVQGREDEALVLHLEPLPAAPVERPPPQPTAAPTARSGEHAQSTAAANHVPVIIAFSVAGAGVIAGTLSGVIALSKKHDVDPAAGYRAADISTASWITAGAGALAGILFWVYEPEPKRKDRALQPRVGVGAVGMEGVF